VITALNRSWIAHLPFLAAEHSKENNHGSLEQLKQKLRTLEIALSGTVAIATEGMLSHVGAPKPAKLTTADLIADG